MKNEQDLNSGRHLTTEQREGIAAGLQDSVTGAVLITAPASDKEAVRYQGEIASVLEEVGCEVEIDHATRNASAPEIPTGIEMTIKEETVRPMHASRILRAFRRVGVVIATKINARRRDNNTLYITVGANDTPARVSPITPTAATWQWRPLAALFARWK